jgi:hypothetical protein
MRNVECGVRNETQAAARDGLPSFRIPHSEFRTQDWWAATDAHLVAVRQHFSPGKSRDFTAKVCSPSATRRRS